jgi:hypothetical protein
MTATALASQLNQEEARNIFSSPRLARPFWEVYLRQVLGLQGQQGQEFDGVLRAFFDDPLRIATNQSQTAALKQDAASPTAEEYARWGISVDGLEEFLTANAAEITDKSTTSDVCNTVIKPHTTPVGWVDELTLINPEEAWYTHRYRCIATGEIQDAAPKGSISYCERMRERGSVHVGRPTVFLSHAWKYGFRNVVAALRAFVDSQTEGSPTVFFWYDCFSVDEHATQKLSQDWWSTTFREAIRLIGHTVMMLSPWNDPQPLTRSWCLWELYCTTEVGAKFSVCLGPVERKDFQQKIVKDVDSVLKAFAKIDVECAEASNPLDQKMILVTAQRSTGGLARINTLAVEKLRAWILHELILRGKLVERKLETLAGDELQDLFWGPLEQAFEVSYQVVTALKRLGLLQQAKDLALASVGAGNRLLGVAGQDSLVVRKQCVFQAHRLLADVLQAGNGGRPDWMKARQIYEDVLEQQAGLLGRQHENTLTTMHNFATLQKFKLRDIKAAVALEEAVIEAFADKFGRRHEKTLVARMNYGVSLKQMGDLSRAHTECQDAAHGLQDVLGKLNDKTLKAQHNFAVVMEKMGQHREARRLTDAVVQGRIAVLGPSDPSTLESKKLLARLSNQLTVI